MGKSICFVALGVYPLLKKTSIGTMGGAELQQILIGKELAQRGYSVTYITMDHGQEPVTREGSFELISTYKPTEGIPVFRFIYPRLVKIWQALNKTNSDIYYVRCASILLGIVVFWARLNKKKVIFCGAIDPDFEPENLQLKYYRDKLLYYWGLKRCASIIVQNAHQKMMLSKNFSRDGVIIHNGMNSRKVISKSRDKILWVANIRQEKDPKAFIDLAKQYPKEEFVMVGGKVKGNGDLYEMVSTESHRLPNLKFKGFLPLDDTEKEFDRAKLFVNTSLHEGFPNTFLQAWRQGIPVLSFFDPDGLIGRHALGRIAKDKWDMAKKLESIIDQKDQINSKSIIKFFNENLIVEKQVDKYEEVFKSLANNDG